jgi:multiple sugar transport system permease protein
VDQPSQQLMDSSAPSRARNRAGALRRRDTLYFFLFTGLSVLGFLLFYLYPIGRTIYLSFTNLKITSPFYEGVGFENFHRVIFDDEIFRIALSNTFKYAVVVGVMKMVLALGAAMLLNNKLRGMAVFRSIFFLPFIIPSFAVAYVFRFFFHPANGVVNEVLGWVGIHGIGWYADSSTALQTLMIASLWSFGVPMLIFLAALQDVPRDLYEVAELEGASRWVKFRHITFPAISPVFLFNATLISIDALKSFDLAFLMGQGSGYPANSTLLYSVYLFSQAFTSPYALGYASAIALIFFLILMTLTGLNFLLGKLYVKSEN